MSELPEVRRADCGHGFLSIDVPPAARQQNGQHEQPVYLCDDCRQRLRSPKVETKDARVVAQRVQYHLPRNPELEADIAPASPREAGRLAALANEPRHVPEGTHPRSAPAREWLAGYDEAKAATDG